MGFKLTILGSSAAVPTKYRSLSSQALEYNQTLYLIDCGEGTQLQMLKYEIKRNRIDHVFISHLHGDHYLGLPGLINTLSLDGRTKPLYVYAPKGLEEYLYASIALGYSPGWNFPLHFIELKENTTQNIFENNHLTIYSTPLMHRIPTWGFIFREKKKERNINRDFIKQYAPDFLTIKEIKKGFDFIDNYGNKIENKLITSDPHPAKSYAYFSDTMFDESLAHSIMGIDALYHESTFSDFEEELARERFHATSRQAATLAKIAGVKRLFLGHISARFLNFTDILEKQAKDVFENSVIVQDGDEFVI
ncbi:MAG: ribonuclease Z [Bacteroidales bacterium]|jgi:ribonuclease Z|nr:ribonuclease Z [Bacteroidales bacterium]